MPLLELHRAGSFQIKLGHMLWDFTTCQFEDSFLVWKYGALSQSWRLELQRIEMDCSHLSSYFHAA